jgi:putative NADH-flavin reductase
VVVGGAGSLEVAPGVQLVDTPDFPAPYKPYALAHREALAVFKAADDLAWTFFSSTAEIGPGEQRGVFRTGDRTLIVGANGHSEISNPDYADAFVSEIEQPRFIQQIATAAY